MQSKLYYVPVPSVPPPRAAFKSHAKKKGPGHIPRPRNAFFLYKSEFIRLHKEALNCAGRSNYKDMSSVAASIWKAMDSNERKKWDKLAALEKSNHKANHPTYEFTPESFAERLQREREEIRSNGVKKVKRRVTKGRDQETLRKQAEENERIGQLMASGRTVSQILDHLNIPWGEDSSDQQVVQCNGEACSVAQASANTSPGVASSALQTYTFAFPGRTATQSSPLAAIPKDMMHKFSVLFANRRTSPDPRINKSASTEDGLNGRHSVLPDLSLTNQQEQTSSLASNLDQVSVAQTRSSLLALQSSRPPAHGFAKFAVFGQSNHITLAGPLPQTLSFASQAQSTNKTLRTRPPAPLRAEAQVSDAESEASESDEETYQPIIQPARPSQAQTVSANINKNNWRGH